MSDFDEVMSRLSKSTRDKVILASEVSEDRIALPSVGITRALGGGIKKNTQTMFWGNRSGGKSALALGTIAEAQRQGMTCALIDAEKSFDPSWARKLGVNPDRLLISPAGSAEEVADVGADMMRSGADVLVVDSISVLLSSAYFSKDHELKDFSDTGQIGTSAKDIGKMLSIFNYVNNNTALIIISQHRTKLGQMYSSQAPTGGEAVQFYNTVSIKLWSSLVDAEQIKGDVHNGNQIFTEKIGRKVHWIIDKDRGPGMMMEGDYNFYYKGDNIGIDTTAEMIEVGVKYGIVEKKGGWYVIYGENKQGLVGAANYVRSNPELQEKLWGELVNV